MKNFITKLKRLLFYKTSHGVITPDRFNSFIDQARTEIDDYVKCDEDIIYLKEINAYGVFKYNVVKEVMMSNDFGVSPMHIELNHIYFQKDEEKHQHNKSTAIKELPFVSKELQFRDNKFTTFVFQKLFVNLPKNRSFDLVVELINPLVFIGALHDLGFLELLNEFNPEDEKFEVQAIIEEVNNIFQDWKYLNLIIENKLKNGTNPDIMQRILDNSSTEKPYQQEDLPQYFSSMILASVENVASFVSSYVYFLFKHYPDLLISKDFKKLEELANEVIRVYTPAPIINREVVRDVKFRDMYLKKGEIVKLYISSANTDPSVFENPHQIKFGRSQKHLSFARGKISCIGQYASFRVAMNIAKELFSYRDKIQFLDESLSINKIWTEKIAVLNTKLND